MACCFRYHSNQSLFGGLLVAFTAAHSVKVLVYRYQSIDMPKSNLCSWCRSCKPQLGMQINECKSPIQGISSDLAIQNPKPVKPSAIRRKKSSTQRGTIMKMEHILEPCWDHWGLKILFLFHVTACCSSSSSTAEGLNSIASSWEKVKEKKEEKNWKKLSRMSGFEIKSKRSNGKRKYDGYKLTLLQGRNQIVKRNTSACFIHKI
jgi:hypothetical protein